LVATQKHTSSAIECVCLISSITIIQLAGTGSR
jgi:hypothetical protein